VAVGLRLGLDICEPHSCRCGLVVDARGLHSLVCKQASERSSRHHMLNDFVARALAAAGVPAVKEPAGLVRQDGKRPDGLTLIPYANGRSLTWDVTVVRSTADFTLIWQFKAPAQWLRWPPLARKPSMPRCRLIKFSSQSQWKHWVCARISGRLGPANFCSERR